MSNHSIIAPSSGGEWGPPDGCTASVTMQRQVPAEPPTLDTLEGEASHEVGEKRINLAKRGNSVLYAPIGLAAANGVMITEEMSHAAQLYADDVRREMTARNIYGHNVGVERRVTATAIHMLAYGTPDCYLHDVNAHTLIVWDYKFGLNPIEVFENWQTLIYTQGIIEELGISDPDLVIKIRIVQPRAFHPDGPIREWVLSISNMPHYVAILNKNAAEALGPNPIARSGPQCRYCTARTYCTTALNAGLSLFETVGQPVPVEITPEQLGMLLTLIRRNKKQLEYLDESYTARIKATSMRGTDTPGWHMKTTKTARAWKGTNSELIEIGKQHGVDLNPQKLITPAKAEDAGLPKSVTEKYTYSPTRLSLKPLGQKQFRKMFSIIEE